MRRFPAGALFSERLADGTLSVDEIERMARRLARFDAQAEIQTDPALARRIRLRDGGPSTTDLLRQDRGRDEA